jgi:hypothetical protein
MADVEAAEPLLQESRSQYPIFKLPAGEEEIVEDESNESAMLPDLGVFHLSVRAKSISSCFLIPSPATFLLLLPL